MNKIKEVGVEDKQFKIRCSGLKETLTPEELDRRLEKIRDEYKEASQKYPNLVRGELGSIDVSFDLPFSLTAKFVGFKKPYIDKFGPSPMEVVEIKSGDRVGRFVRGEPLTVSTSGGGFYFCIHIFPELPREGHDHPLTDRGLCWADPGKKKTYCHLIIENWEKHPWESGEIARIVRKAKEQVLMMIEQALNSKVKRVY